MARQAKAKETNELNLEENENITESVKEPVAESQELDLEKKVTVKSIAGWETGFNRILEFGSVSVVPYGSIRISRNEIIAQIQNGNVAFSGTDGRGSHATYYIEDKPTRIEVGFEDKEHAQLFLNEDIVKKLFNIKEQKAFENAFREAVVTRAEKKAVLSIVKKLGINDFNKIRFVENYTGFKMQ
jgi:hypothetical protein